MTAADSPVAALAALIRAAVRVPDGSVMTDTDGVVGPVDVADVDVKCAPRGRVGRP
jgi:hypothetical protein